MSAAVLGLRANWRQFALLVAINGFVGGMVGLERSILPVLARDEFGIGSKTAVLSFIAAFGSSKAIANLVAGNLSERTGRRRLLIAGWLIGAPVPLMLIWAPSWSWVIAANLLLGLNQGLCWSMTVNMKLDLAGQQQRGLALGFNEAAGYVAVAAAAFASGLIADHAGLRPEPFYLGIAFVAGGLALSALLVRDTTRYVRIEAGAPGAGSPSLGTAFAETTWRRPHLFGVTQAGFVSNLNDGMAWGLFPLLFVSRGFSLDRIALLAALYPLLWGALQLGTGWLSDVVGRRPVIVTGMIVQAAAIALIASAASFGVGLAAVSFLGLGTALVYPALLAAVGDAARPHARATSLGVYRFWRDSGTIAGALTAGALADIFSLTAAIFAIAAVTAASGIVAAATLHGKHTNQARTASVVALA